MNSKIIIKEMNNLVTIQRFLYVIFAFYLVLLEMLNVHNNLTETIIVLSVLAMIALLDEVFLIFDYFQKNIFLSLWRYVQYLITIVGLYNCFDFPYATIAILSFCFLFVIEFIVAGDMFDSISYMWRLVGLLIPIFVFSIVMMGSDKEYKWLYICLSFIILFIAILRVVLFINGIFHAYQEDIHERDYRLSTAESMNLNLLEYQDRVKVVNEELNMQSIELKHANDQIRIANAEITVQANIAKYIASTYDIPATIQLVLETIVKEKKLAFGAIYVNSDVYLNRHATSMVISDNSGIKRRLNRDLPGFYKQYRTKYSAVIIDNEASAEKYPFIGEDLVKAIILRPMFLEDKLYGVFIVGSTYHEFDNSNLSFIDAMIAQLNTAVSNAKLYRQTQRMAQKDGLTGINNRTHFNTIYNETLTQIIEQKSCISVALFDIDKFKRLNDTYGHLAGDEVIKKVARVTEEHIEQYNGFVCRYGGEEFVAVLPNVQVDDATKIIEELHKKIATSVVEYGGDRIGMNVSIGLTAYPQICDNPYDLLKRADWAMYYAKEHGRGQIKVDGSDVVDVNS